MFRRSDLPDGTGRFGKLGLDAEDCARDLRRDAIPHLLETEHSFSSVFGLRIFLCVSDQSDSHSQMVHEVQVVFPLCIEHFDEDRAFGLINLAPISTFVGLADSPLQSVIVRF